MKRWSRLKLWCIKEGGKELEHNKFCSIFFYKNPNSSGQNTFGKRKTIVIDELIFTSYIDEVIKKSIYIYFSLPTC